MRPLVIRRVVGHSMEPTLRENQIVIASGLLPMRSGNVVIAKVGKLEVIKRFTVLPNNQRMLTGDNKSGPHDKTWSKETSLVGIVFWPRN